jgi:hypothetical protein
MNNQWENSPQPPLESPRQKCRVSKAFAGTAGTCGYCSMFKGWVFIFFLLRIFPSVRSAYRPRPWRVGHARWQRVPAVPASTRSTRKTSRVGYSERFTREAHSWARREIPRQHARAHARHGV